MTRLSEMLDPDAIMRRFEERISRLEKQNPLNNASFDGQIRLEVGATILAGTVTILQNGIELPWGAGRQELRTILDAIDGRARSAGEGVGEALARANSAHDRITTVSGNVSYVNDRVDTVSARATNALDAANAAQSAANTAQSRADSAYSLAEGRVTQTQRNVLVAKINQIIAVMATEGSNPKPPPIQG